jgi:oxaloacetate decarboxylase alpha subunit
MHDIELIDVTLRDAHQSLWSTRMTNAMIAPSLDTLDRIGYATIDLVGGAVFDVCVRYLKENPWERMRMATARLRTPANVWLRGQSLFTFEMFPDDVVDATVRHIAACGIRRITTYDALNDIRNVEVTVRAGLDAGLGVTGAIAFTMSPVHTDDFYEARASELLGLGIDRLCIKDPSGLLRPERIGTLAPRLVALAGRIPVELHSHCLSGLAPLVYAVAMHHGVHYFHTAVAPLANGASLPAAEDLLGEAHAQGLRTPIDEARLREASDYFRWVALREDKPIGERARYDPALYEHQVPGGMISNLRTQLAMVGVEHRLQEVLHEVAEVRKDLGYPIMVSPFAQFLITQATLNVVQGKRYATVPDELKKYALGYYGRPAAPIAPDFAALAAGHADPIEQRPGAVLPPALPGLRRARGPFSDDDALLLAAYYDDTLVRDVTSPPARAAAEVTFSTTPMDELVGYLSRSPDIADARIRWRGIDMNVSREARVP